MSTHIRPAGSTYGDLADYPARDIKTSRFTPDTQAEYRDLVHAFGAMQKWYLHLRALKTAYDKTPERWQDVYQGIPGVWPLELDEAIEKAEAMRDEMEAGLDEWERFS